MCHHEIITIPAPLYCDPIYNGATDPTVIWNNEEKNWWMFYTQRRASDISIGFSHIHGTQIGIASSTDLCRWLYRGTLPGLDFEPGHNTFWAPEVLYAKGEYHMYVSYITGVPTDWNWPRHIVHYTAKDLWQWQFQSVLPLSSGRVIDACVYETTVGHYKMWYKDEAHHSHTYCAYSEDLYHWTAGDAEVNDCAHEGPNVFELESLKWMITDCWDGLAVYESDDYVHWRRQAGNFLQTAGQREGDGAQGHHADVLVLNDSAYLFYFTHPDPQQPQMSAIQVAELKMKGDKLTCDRDAVIQIGLPKQS